MALPVLRGWQADRLPVLLARLEASRPRRALVVAPPGLGKSLFGAFTARELVSDGLCKSVIVVVPRVPLREQWAKELRKCGIQIDYMFRNAQRRPNPNVFGVAVTYSQVANDPTLFKELTARYRPLVLCDEPHHLSVEREWGSAAIEAFSDATALIGLSGTAWRSDASKIPFFEYDRLGSTVPTVEVTMEEAITSGDIRDVKFRLVDGDAEWTYGDEDYSHGLSEDLTPKLNGQRLRTAIDLDFRWSKDLLVKADKELTRIREVEDPRAGGLAVTWTIENARRIGAFLREVTGEEAIVVSSADPDSSKLIDAFRRGSQRWIVAVAMVSEGVDIPRLRVGAFLTRIRTKLHFIQLSGRLTRVPHRVPGERPRPSVFFLPSCSPFREFAEGWMRSVSPPKLEATDREELDEAEIERLLAEQDGEEAEEDVWSEHDGADDGADGPGGDDDTDEDGGRDWSLPIFIPKNADGLDVLGDYEMGKFADAEKIEARDTLEDFRDGKLSADEVFGRLTGLWETARAREERPSVSAASGQVGGLFDPGLAPEARLFVDVQREKREVLEKRVNQLWNCLGRPNGGWHARANQWVNGLLGVSKSERHLASTEALERATRVVDEHLRTRRDPVPLEAHAR